MKRFRTMFASIGLLLLFSVTAPAAEPANPFFALCIGTHDAATKTPADQAKLLKELGYAGNCHLWCDGVEETLAALDDAGLELFQVYVRVSIDPSKPKYDPQLPEVIKRLKGHRTTLGLLVSGAPASATENDDRAVAIVREIGDMAKASGIRAALYPHTGDFIERLEDAVRIAEKVDRENVGAMFNLCHWMKVDGRQPLEPLLKSAMPHLFVVTINGADNAPGEGWDRLIRPLDQGTFDNRRLMGLLAKLGYKGPVGLQCYGIRGDMRDNLARSMTAWKDLSAKPMRLNNPFFAFDNGIDRGRLSADEQADLLAELGYAGIGYTGGRNIPEMLAALDRHKLSMSSIYVGATIGPDGPSYDPAIKQAIEDLKGRETLIWLTVNGKADDADEQAVKVVREIGELAERSGLRVALYPHYGFFVAKTTDAIRIAEKVDRKNVGVSLNLCHWLRSGDEANMEARIKQAMPRLFVVSINGADHEGGWDRLIQTLDQGEFDVYAFLSTLKRHGYTGPIGLQCYAVKGDKRENLQRSMKTWQGFVARMEAGK